MYGGEKDRQTIRDTYSENENNIERKTETIRATYIGGAYINAILEWQ